MSTNYKCKNVSGEKYDTTPKYSDFDIFCMLERALFHVSLSVHSINDIAKLFSLEDNKYSLIVEDLERLNDINRFLRESWFSIEDNREECLKKYSEFIKEDK